VADFEDGLHAARKKPRAGPIIAVSPAASTWLSSAASDSLPRLSAVLASNRLAVAAEANMLTYARLVAPFQGCRKGLTLFSAGLLLAGFSVTTASVLR